MGTSKKRILLIAQNLDDMVLDDSKILKKYYRVDTLIVKNATELVKRLPAMCSKIRKADLCFIWFAGAYAVPATILCKIFRKKSLIVTGGYDVVTVPDIGYGLPLHPIKRIFPSISLKLADLILPFSIDSSKEMLKNFKIDKRKVKVVHLGVTAKMHKKTYKKLNIAATVGVICKSNLKRKGLETFVKAAKYVPEAMFMLIGDVVDNSIEHLKSFAEPNVYFKNLGYETDKILEHLSRAKVYVQVSAHEGFGRACAEAMSMGCVPVVTKRGAIPEVVGNAGFYVPVEDPKATAKAVKKALRAKNKSMQAKARIMRKFPLSKREGVLIRLIKELI